MRPTIRILLIASTLVGLVRSARADVVSEWIERAAAAGYRASVVAPMNGRNVALVTVAIFDALNAITPRYAPYRAQGAAKPGTSPDAAVAAAAHYLLVRLYPDQVQSLDSTYTAALATVAEGAPKANGIELGERVAAALFDERKTDGSDATNSYRPAAAPGAYVSTALPITPRWGAVRPFVLRAGNQFRPAAPHALKSAEWATDYNEVMRLGAKTGSQRTAEQTEIARFWEFAGPGTYMPVARQAIAARGLGALESARVCALVAMAAADAIVAVFDAKYAYGFWRPVTAIRNGDQDGNDATERDSTWESFVPTPMHPEYPCAHCITQSAVASVLGALFGDTLAFSLTSPTAPGVTRRYARFSDYAAEVLNARVYDGVHYRTSGEVGAAMGRQIGAYVVANALKPAR